MINNNISKNTLYLIVIGIILILIAGLRPIGIDGDSLNYASVLGVHLENANFIDKEPMFWLINEFNHLVFNSEVQTFFLLFAILGVSLKLYAIKKLALYPLMSVLIYISFYFILHEMTQIRVGVSIALIYLSIPFIINRELFKFIFILLIATLFHYSSIIFFLLYFIVNINFGKMIYYLLPIIGLVLSLLNFGEILVQSIVPYLPDILSIKLEIYMSKMEQGKMKLVNPVNFGNLLLIIVYYINLYKTNFNDSDNQINIILIKMLSMGFLILFAFSYLEVFAYRMSNFLFFSIVFLIPNILSFFKQKIIIIAFTLLYLFYSLIKNTNIMLNL